MQQSSSIRKPLLVTAFITIDLLVAVVVAWQLFPVPEEYLRHALVVSFFFAVALIAALVFQSYRITASAQNLAKGMTKDMLTYSHELFSEMYRSSPVPYILIDAQGKIESINFSTARLFHVEIDALEGLNAFDFITGEDADKIALIPEYFQQGKFINDTEVEIRRPDGVLRFVLLSLFSFSDAKGSRKGLLTLVDITKQKMVDKAKTEFVSLASHQLRTPISSMKWNTELLETAAKNLENQVVSGYIEKIAHGLERMDLLVDDFLSVSKLELGTLVAQRAPLELSTFIQGICDEQSNQAKQKQVDVVTSLGSLPENVKSDSNLLHMIVSNLLSNAIKYTRTGGTVTVKGESGDTEYTLSVEDSGIGIPEDDQEMIFSKLFRAGNARSQVTDGTGLGLYIVKEAVRILGGTISFVSKEGVGTTFTVTMPR